MSAIKKGVRYYFSNEGWHVCCFAGGCVGALAGSSIAAKQTLEEGLPLDDIGKIFFNTVATMAHISMGAIVGSAAGAVFIATAPISIPSSLCIAYRLYNYKNPPKPLPFSSQR